MKKASQSAEDDEKEQEAAEAEQKAKDFTNFNSIGGRVYNMPWQIYNKL